MDAAPAVHHRCARVVTHAARAGLVLARAQAQADLPEPYLLGASRAQPLPRSLADELGCAHRLRVRSTAKACYGLAVLVAHVRRNRHPRLRVGYLLHRALHLEPATVGLPHPALIARAPTRDAIRPGLPPEVDGRLDEVIGNHRAANDAGVAVAKLATADRGAGTEVAQHRLVHYPVAARIIVALQE